tara:strand:+ start:540 stop:1487 length:948 start_codon:yes stop_codon:yes gene_type:complete
MARGPVPFHAWIILSAAVVAVSSAGAVLQSIDEIPPLLRMGWRLQATSLVLFPFAMVQWLRLDQENRSFVVNRRNFSILFASGFCLFLHFATWGWSLDNTSLTHSLLFVTAHPLVFVIGAAIIGRPLLKRQSYGALLAFVGAALSLLSIGEDGEVTLIGDLAAFAGAVAIVGYLSAGRELRSWMPLFVYAFPVTFFAAILLTISSIFFETSDWNQILSISTFGWIDMIWLPAIAYLAIGPGLIGHTGINGVLKWLPPIVISVSVLIEPILGTFIGIMLGTANYPDYWTLIGGSIILFGLYLVISADEKTIVNSEE